MKKMTNLLVIALAFFAVTASSFAKENDATKKAEIKSSAFTFEQKLQIENLIWDMEGVEDAKYDTKTKILTVKYDSEKLTTDMMVYSITNNLGLSADVITDKKASECKDTKTEKEKSVIGVNIDNLNIFQMLEKKLAEVRDNYLNSVLFAK
jgi:ABC-type uncharacterized transport system YnjBCD substrate-binding protein